MPLPGNFTGESLQMAQVEAETASMDNKGEILLDQDILTYIQKVTKNDSCGKEPPADKRETRGSKRRPSRQERKHEPVVEERRGQNRGTHRCHTPPPSDVRKVASHSDGNVSITVQTRSSSTKPNQGQNGGENRGKGDKSMGGNHPSAHRPAVASNAMSITQCLLGQFNNGIFYQQGYNNQQGYSNYQGYIMPQQQQQHPRQQNLYSGSWDGRYSSPPIPFWQDYPVDNFPWNTQNHHS